MKGDVLKIEILFHIFLLQHFTVRTEEIELASVGDGNLNDVIRVKNASKSVILKSAPPYIKVDTCFLQCYTQSFTTRNTSCVLFVETRAEWILIKLRITFDVSNELFYIVVSGSRVSPGSMSRSD